ncbi:hypothetical protein HII28_19500 [Planctomonas sp. JC2975]|uniref:hypothetical protein n=1 Tax=Planctomonas sp. JC2975 TaxID=2729626 RepID=UPI00147405E4|nr:hypothetical protein [Planctomonas sp. JC2975]NNC14049.1 hypothetical protein [Planctomonas sp. JC2975]
MASSGSTTQQHTAVGEGLALGAIMLGLIEVNGSKGTLELDFRRAWRNWEYAALFPAVKAVGDRDDVIRILIDSHGRSGPRVARWDGSWPFVPVLRVEQWTADEVADSIDKRVPAHAWADLVRAWLSLPSEE